MAVKNALSIINFNLLPVNIKKQHDALLLILYVFEINFCFPLIIRFTDFNQVGINVSALQIKKHNREQIQYLTEKKPSKIHRQQCYSMFFWFYYFGVWNLSKCNKCYDIS